MALVTTSISEQQFQCSICLEVFSEPVTTPCGHNYCKNCINGYWAHAVTIQCPLCAETFHSPPLLRVNTEFREMLQLFKQTRATSDDDSSSIHPGVVTCDLCRSVKCKAIKSCLVCLASYCGDHLQPHHTVPAFKWHKLINPVATLADRVCKKHNKVTEFFCSQDQSCVCILCLRDDHVTHKAVTVEEELKDRKDKLKGLINDVNKTRSEKGKMAERIQNAIKQSRQEVDRTEAETERAFTALVSLIIKTKMNLVEQLEGKQKAAEQKAEAFIKQLQLEMAENNRMSTTLEDLLKTEDSFRLLQGLPSISSPPSSKQQFTATSPFFQAEAIKKMVAKTRETLTEELDNIIREATWVTEEETAAEMMATQEEGVFEDELGKIQKQYAMKVTLDYNTAHPALIVSGDRKQVRDGGITLNVPDSSSRFDSLHFVLGNEGFSSGMFYYEVMVKGQTGWEVGVVRESINRKGMDLSLSPENGCWTMGLYRGYYQANSNPPVILFLSEELQKVGVFVDYEGGLVSFYDVNARTLIYSFTQCAFTLAGERLLSRLIKLRVYSVSPEKTVIYPIFRPSSEGGRESAPLRITPVGFSTGA